MSECGAIFSLDVLIAAFQFRNEHLMWESAPQQHVFADSYWGRCSLHFKYLLNTAETSILHLQRRGKVKRLQLMRTPKDSPVFQGQSAANVYAIIRLRTWADWNSHYKTKVWLARGCVLPLDAVNYDARCTNKLSARPSGCAGEDRSDEIC